jgi:hypothetical protein
MSQIISAVFSGFHETVSSLVFPSSLEVERRFKVRSSAMAEMVIVASRAASNRVGVGFISIGM